MAEIIHSISQSKKLSNETNLDRIKEKLKMLEFFLIFVSGTTGFGLKVAG